MDFKTKEFNVQFCGHKSRDDREVQAFAKLVEVKGVSVKSLNLNVNSLASVAAQRTLFELPVLSQLEALTISQDFSLGATCVDTLVEVLGAGHIRSLVKLDLRYHGHDSRGLGGGVGAVSLSDMQASLSNSRSVSSLRGGFGDVALTDTQASLSNSRSLSSPRSGVTNSQNLITSTSSFGSTSNDPSHVSPYPFVSWNGFASLATAIGSGWLPKLDGIELHVSFDSKNLGDEGAEALAKLIETGKVSSMKELNLENNSITPIGIEALGRAFKRGNLPHMIVLNLSKNSFQSASEDPNSGVMELITALEDNRFPSLKRIGLAGAGRQSTPTGARAIYGRSIAEAMVEVYTRNTALIATIDIDWPERALETRWNLALQRNVKLTELLKTLNAGDADVPVRNGKIFICGFPGVGKTTLRKSLKRSKWTAFFFNELKPHHEIPTRGIEVTHINGRKKNTEGTLLLTLWDLAGQEEFHVLHSSFLPDLGMANGKGTTFVVVLNSTYNRDEGDASAEDQLTYWLRFIASNSISGTKRNVIVALNTFDGGTCLERPQWNELVGSLHARFEDILEIRSEPIVLDARIMKSVKKLKESLFEHTGSVLHGLRWPKVCQYIQSNLRNWAKENQNFPVITWIDFTGKMAASRLGREKLEAAVEYLHETGHLIYFRKGSLKEGESSETRLIVLDPQWFCKRIVGELLLPDALVREGEKSLRLSVARDGSLYLREITGYFKDLLKNSPQVNYVVGMLIRLGLCYKVGCDKVLVPALVEQDELPEQSWGRDANRRFMGQWVMGRSLALMDTETTALPKSLFRRLQVQLAQDPDLGGHPNSGYSVGKSFLTFKKSGIMILVQCDVHEDDPRDDRIDMITKPLLGGDSHMTQRKKQIELVEVVMERLGDLCFVWCPGLKFVQKVILPWSESEGVKPMLDRNTKFTLDDIRTMVQRNGLGSGYSDLNWLVYDEEVREVREEEVLSSNEIDELRKKIDGDVDEQDRKLKQLVIDFDLLPERSSAGEGSRESRTAGIQSDEPTNVEGTIRISSSASIDTKSASNGPLHQLETKIEEEAEKTRQHIQLRFQNVERRINEVTETAKEVGDNFRRSFEIQRRVLQKIQHLEFLSLKQMEVMVPRFCFLADKSGTLLTPQRAIQTKAQLHLLCEARYNDGMLHAVDGQRGIDISKLKDWAAAVAPWLENSLKYTIVLSQIVGGALVPGLNLLFPEFEKQEAKTISKALAHEIMTRDAEESTMRSGSRRCTVMELNEQAKYILKSLLGEPLQHHVLEKFGLRRVMLRTDALPKIAWICGPCYRKYGKSKLATDLSHPSL